MLMRPVALLALVLALTAAPVVSHSPNSALERLLEPREKQWFGQLSKTEKANILESLHKAQLCVARFQAKSGKKDAELAAKLSKPHFLSGVSNGYAVYSTTPGIEGCSGPSVAPLSDSFVELDEAYDGPPRTLALQSKCSTLANHYAADFNRALATERPEAFRKACPSGRAKER